MLEFAEISSAFLKLNIAAFFTHPIKIFIDFALRNKTDIPRQQMLGQISNAVEISDAETLNDSFFLLVGKLIKHRA